MAVDYMMRDRIRELWQQIDHLHLNYLQTDESPRKIDEKKKLEGKNAIKTPDNVNVVMWRIVCYKNSW